MKAGWWSPERWAEAEFSGAQVGDVRRGRRLVRVAAALAAQPHGALHAAIDDASELEAAYRLASRPEVSFEAVTQPHRERTRARCREHGEYLLIEDTTTLDFTRHEAAQGLGRIGDDRGRGLFLHTTMAARIEGWNAEGVPDLSAVGLFAQHCWARTSPSIGRGKEKKHARLTRPRESQRWAAYLDDLSPPAAKVRWTLVADREADIYEALQRCRRAGVNYIVRACQARGLADEPGSIFDAVAARPPLGTYDMALRARPGQARRTAKLEVRSATVTLQGPWRPGKVVEPLTLQVVEAREIDAPSNATPLHWVLLTSWPADSLEASRQVLGAYARRNLIEEYHKALKSGAGVEESQLVEAHSLMTLTGILSVVALRLLNLKLHAVARGDQALPKQELAPDMLKVLALALEKPKPKWTYRLVLEDIAKLGGFKPTKNAGSPGWQTLWRGWHRLTTLTEGFRLAQGSKDV